MTLGLVAVATGTLDFGFDPVGWVWLGLAALVSTVVAVVLFFSGMSRVGPSTAAILSTLEPPVTVALVFLTFGEALGLHAAVRRARRSKRGCDREPAGRRVATLS